MPSLDPELASIVQWTEDAAVRQPKAPDSKEKDAKAPVTERTLPKGPVYWVREPSTEAVVTNGAAANHEVASTAEGGSPSFVWRAVSVGTESANPRRKIIATLAQPGLEAAGRAGWLSRAQLGSGATTAV